MILKKRTNEEQKRKIHQKEIHEWLYKAIREQNLCDIVTKKIFSTSAGETPPSHQAPNVTR